MENNQDNQDNLQWLDELPKNVRHNLLVEVEDLLANHRLADYRPYKKQLEFHTHGATKQERLLRAGNQFGKTLAVAAEAAMHLTGLYPDWWAGRRWNRPITMWAAGETAETTRDNPQRMLCGQVGALGTGMIPAKHFQPGGSGKAAGTSELFDFIRIKHISGGHSLLRFKYYAQGSKKWQGPSIDFIWFDEEPPIEVYLEGLARTIATGGCIALSFTPLLGMTVVVNRFLNNEHGNCSDTKILIEDAEHIPPEERERIINSFPEHERRARIEGEPTLGSGRVFPFIEDSFKCKAFEPPGFWPQLGAIDFGWDHPTAAVRLVLDPDADVIYLMSVYRQSHETSLIHASTLLTWGAWLPWAWPHDGLQHEKGGGIQLRAQYASHGLKMMSEHAQFLETDSRVSRISVEAGIMLLFERIQTGRFKVFDHLEDWFSEFRLYHRKEGKIVKVKDDLLDCTRYGIMMIREAISPAQAKARLKQRNLNLMPARCVRQHPHYLNRERAAGYA